MAAPAKPEPFDIAPFALPGTPPGELRWEEPREIVAITAQYAGPPPTGAVEYLHGVWPERTAPFARPFIDPVWFGWVPEDDPHNVNWRAGTATRALADGAVTWSFGPIESDHSGHGAARFRKTLGIRVPAAGLRSLRAFSTGTPFEEVLRVQSAAIRGGLACEGYNLQVVAIAQESPTSWRVRVRGQRPRAWDSGDAALLSILIGGDVVTVSLESLRQEGPNWAPHRDLYVSLASGHPTLRGYLDSLQDARTTLRTVQEAPEQTWAGAFHGQPRGHAVSTNLGVPHSRHRFWLEASGDLYIEKRNVDRPPGPDTPRFRCPGSARFYFGFERWMPLARMPDPPPALIQNLLFRNGAVECVMRAFAAPMSRTIDSGELRGDEPTAAYLSFTFVNRSAEPVAFDWPVVYSDDSRRSENSFANAPQDDWLRPNAKPAALSLDRGAITSAFDGKQHVRALLEDPTAWRVQDGAAIARVELQPDEARELAMIVPSVAPSPEEIASLGRTQARTVERQVASYWREEGRRGAQLRCPEPRFEALHLAHIAHVGITDYALPDDPALINTSVGTSTYGNFSNESAMVVAELDARGLHNEARRRLHTWIKYQGTAKQPGMFTDFEGMYYGAGGFEEGAYNQHHGWVLWALANHFLLTRDADWFAQVASSMLAGAQWIIRQRAHTKNASVGSRGWESGFMPAGSVEDVTDFHFWLSSNTMIWRGLEWAARAFAAAGHPESARLRVESDAMAEDLRRGFKIARQRSPLVRLRDGRWVPHTPSRLYRRGRDVGWLRETLEGSIFLLTSSLVDPESEEAGWILDDYADNRYPKAPYGWTIHDRDSFGFDQGGIAIQPNLMGGLLPHLDRDEPQAFLWMLCNGFVATYREEIGAMVEYTPPVLGFWNPAHFKTSDQANWLAWLRHGLIYAGAGLLHVGRAAPRDWLSPGRGFELAGLRTVFGEVSARYEVDESRTVAVVETRLHEAPNVMRARFRDGRRRPILSATVNGEEVTFQGEDVPMPNESGRFEVAVTYAVS